jgi:hypothetical protein
VTASIRAAGVDTNDDRRGAYHRTDQLNALAAAIESAEGELAVMR